MLSVLPVLEGFDSSRFKACLQVMMLRIHNPCRLSDGVSVGDYQAQRAVSPRG